MARWWNHKYPFRRQLVFRNGPIDLDSTRPLFCFPSLDPQIFLMEEEKVLNATVIYQNGQIARQIANQVNYFEDSNSTEVAFSLPIAVSAYEQMDTVYLYYGASEEDVVDPYEISYEPSFFTENSSAITYHPPDDWLLISGESETHFATTSTAASLTVEYPMSHITVNMIASTSFTSVVRFRINEEDWQYIQLKFSEEALGYVPGDTYTRYQLDIPVYDLESNYHSITIENTDLDLGNIELMTIMNDVDDPWPNMPVLKTISAGSGPASLGYETLDTYSDTGLFIQNMNYFQSGIATLGSEEMTEALPWNSKIGGAVVVR